MTDVEAMVSEFAERVAWQRLPVEMAPMEYITMLRGMIDAGIKRMFIRTGRYAMCHTLQFVYDGEEPDTPYLTKIADYDMPADEQEYVILDSQIAFYKRLAGSVNTMTSYSTDALSVTGGDKPYKNIQETISELKREQAAIYYTMVRHTI